jgi:hypothetical protein
VKPSLGVVVVGESETDLLEIIAAGRSSARFAGSLDRRQEKPDEGTDDRDHHEQLDERKPALGWNGATTRSREDRAFGSHKGALSIKKMNETDERIDGKARPSRRYLVWVLAAVMSSIAKN